MSHQPQGKIENQGSVHLLSGMDERTNGYVRVRIEIPNLKAKGRSKFFGGRKDEAKNAKIEFNPQERSVYCLICINHPPIDTPLLPTNRATHPKWMQARTERYTERCVAVQFHERNLFRLIALKASVVI